MKLVSTTLMGIAVAVLVQGSWGDGSGAENLRGRQVLGTESRSNPESASSERKQGNSQRRRLGLPGIKFATGSGENTTTAFYEPDFTAKFAISQLDLEMDSEEPKSANGLFIYAESKFLQAGIWDLRTGNQMIADVGMTEISDKSTTSPVYLGKGRPDGCSSGLLDLNDKPGYLPALQSFYLRANASIFSVTDYAVDVVVDKSGVPTGEVLFCANDRSQEESLTSHPEEGGAAFAWIPKGSYHEAGIQSIRMKQLKGSHSGVLKPPSAEYRPVLVGFHVTFQTPVEGDHFDKVAVGVTQDEYFVEFLAKDNPKEYNLELHYLFVTLP